MGCDDFDLSTEVDFRALGCDLVFFLPMTGFFNSYSTAMVEAIFCFIDFGALFFLLALFFTGWVLLS
jgi:hypothetical protein